MTPCCCETTKTTLFDVKNKMNTRKKILILFMSTHVLETPEHHTCIRGVGRCQKVCVCVCVCVWGGGGGLGAHRDAHIYVPYEKNQYKRDVIGYMVIYSHLSVY